MEQSDSFDLLVGNGHNVSYDHAEVSSGRVRAAAASEARLTVCARTTATHSFHVVATQLGHVNFTVQVNWHLLRHTHTHTRACALEDERSPERDLLAPTDWTVSIRYAGLRP